MWAQILVVLAVVALFVWWLRTPRGREARSLLGRAREVLIVALLLWGLVWVLGDVDLGPLDQPLLTLPDVGIVVTGSLLTLLAAHLLASALVPVLIRFLMTGAITLILLIAHTTHEHGKTTVRTAYRANVDVQTIASITCENPWPRQIAASVHGEAPELVVRGAGLLAAVVSLVFLAAFVRGRQAPA